MAQHYSQEMKHYTEFNESARPIDPTRGFSWQLMHIMAVNLCRRYDLLSFLPVALLSCTTLDIYELLEAHTDPTGTHWRLTTADAGRVLSARETLASLRVKQFCGMTPPPECRQYDACRRAFTDIAIEYMNTISPDADMEIFTAESKHPESFFQLCRTCQDHRLDHYKRIQVEAWTDLPDIFCIREDVEDWSD